MLPPNGAMAGGIGGLLSRHISRSVAKVMGALRRIDYKIKIHEVQSANPMGKSP